MDHKLDSAVQIPGAALPWQFGQASNIRQPWPKVVLFPRFHPLGKCLVVLAEIRSGKTKIHQNYIPKIMCLYQRSADFCHYIVHTYSYQLVLVSNPEAPRDSASGFSMFLPLLQVESMSSTALTQGAATNSELVASMYFLTAPNRRAPCF